MVRDLTEIDTYLVEKYSNACQFGLFHIALLVTFCLIKQESMLLTVQVILQLANPPKKL